MMDAPHLVPRLPIIYHHLKVNTIHNNILSTTSVLLLRRINEPRPTISLPRQGPIRIQIQPLSPTITLMPPQGFRHGVQGPIPKAAPRISIGNR